MFGKIAQLVQKPLNKFSGDGRKGLSSIGWMGASQFSGLIFRLGSNLVLTRLLAPDCFGLMGTALAFLTMLEWLSDLGIYPAIIRHPNGKEARYLNSGWWIGLYRAVGLTSVACLCAGPAADFYGRPDLYWILIVLSMRPLIMAMRSPAIPMLRRELKYRSIFIDELTMTIFGTTASVLWAWFHPSVWAIVGGTVAGAVSGIIVSYILCPHKIGRRDPEASREICRFGRAVLLNTLVMALWLNLDRLLGLRLVSATEMGLYTIAFNLTAVAEGLVTRACDVHFSMLSRLDSQEKQHANHEQIIRKVSLWVMPAFALAAIASPFIISVLYDERYQGAGVLLGILLVRLMIRGLGQVQFQYLMARDHVGIATVGYGLALVTHAALVVPLTQTFGVAGLALSALFSTTVLTCGQAAMTQRRLATRLVPFRATLVWMSCTLVVLGMV